MWFKNQTTKTKKIDDQVMEYVTWKANYSSTVSTTHRVFLEKFLVHTNAQDITEIQLEEIQKFLELINSQNNISYYMGAAAKAVRGVLRYYKARGYPCLMPEKIDEKQIKQIFQFDSLQPV